MVAKVIHYNYYGNYDPVYSNIQSEHAILKRPLSLSVIIMALFSERDKSYGLETRPFPCRGREGIGDEISHWDKMKLWKLERWIRRDKQNSQFIITKFFNFACRLADFKPVESSKGYAWTRDRWGPALQLQCSRGWGPKYYTFIVKGQTSRQWW